MVEVMVDELTSVSSESIDFEEAEFLMKQLAPANATATASKSPSLSELTSVSSLESIPANVQAALVHMRTTSNGRKRISIESEDTANDDEDDGNKRLKRKDEEDRNNLPASTRKPTVVRESDGTVTIKWGPGRPRKYPRPDDDPEVKRFLERQLAKDRRPRGRPRKQPREEETEEEEEEEGDAEEGDEEDENGFLDAENGSTSPLVSSSDEEFKSNKKAGRKRKNSISRIVLSDPIEEWIRAAKHGQLAMLEALLKKGQIESVNVHKSGSRITALHAAAAANHREVVTWLLKNGADPLAVSSTTSTPIDACHSSTLKHLMQLHSDRWKARLGLPQITAAWTGDKQAMRVLAKKPLEYDIFGYDAIHVASLRNDVPILQLLVQAHPDAVNQVTKKDGNSPLHDACRYGSAEACRILLDAGAKWSLRNQLGEIAPSLGTKATSRVIRKWAREHDITDERLWSATATQRWHQLDSGEEAELMVKEVQQKQQQEVEIAPLRPSREERKLQQALALIEKEQQEKGIGKREKSKSEVIPSKKSVVTSKIKSIPAIVSKPEIVSSKKNNSTGRTKEEKSVSPVRPSAVLDTKWRDPETGQSQLHRAAARDQRDLANALLEADGNLLSVEDREGQTAIHVACREGQSRVLKALLASARNLYLNQIIDQVDTQGRTPLHLASLHNHPRLIRVLLHADARMDIRDANGKLAYDLASGEGRADFERIRPESLKKTTAAVSVAAVSVPLRIVTTKKTEDPAPSSPFDTLPLEPLLLVNVGNDTGSPEWYFLSIQIEMIWRSKVPKSTFVKAHESLFQRLQTADERQLLLSSPLMKRAPKLATHLKDHPDAPINLLAKDQVYRAFSEAGLTLGGVSVIYVDLQRLMMRLQQAS